MKETVLITGGATGIGRATSELFALMGYQVAIAANSSFAEVSPSPGPCRSGGFPLPPSGRTCGTPPRWTPSSPGGKALRRGGYPRQQRRRRPAEALHRHHRRRLAGDARRQSHRPLPLLPPALPHMIHQKKGSIVNVSSMWGLTGASCEVHYSAAKAGLIGLTKALAKEVGPSGIRVNCVAPGAVNTRMNQTLDEEALSLLTEETPLGRIGDPEDIARAIAFLACEDSSFTTGQVLSPNGGLVI